MEDQLINKVESTPRLQLEEVLDRHSEVFKERLGQLKGVTARIKEHGEAQPKFCKPRPAPYVVKPLVEREG